MPFSCSKTSHLILWAQWAIATFHLLTPNGSNFIWCASADVDARIWVASVLIRSKIRYAPNVLVVRVSVQEAYFLRSRIAQMTIDIIRWPVISIRAAMCTNRFATPEASCKAVCLHSAIARALAMRELAFHGSLNT